MAVEKTSISGQTSAEAPIVPWTRAHALLCFLALWFAYAGGDATPLALSALLSFAALHAKHKPPARRFGTANWLTTARLLAVSTLLLGGPQMHGPVVALVGLLVLLVDGLDGWVARRLGTANQLGAVYDAEVDACLVAALCVLLASRAPSPLWGIWLVCAGSLRYAYVLLLWAAPARRPEPTRTRYGRVAYGLFVGALVIAHAQPSPASGWVLALGSAVAVLSFATTCWHIYRPDTTAPPAS